MTFEISAQPRTVFGNQVKQLRRDGFVPCELYGKGFENVHLQVNEREMATLFRSGARNEVISLTVNGTVYSVRVSELQRHPTRKNFLHIDFQIA